MSQNMPLAAVTLMVSGLVRIMFSDGIAILQHGTILKHARVVSFIIPFFNMKWLTWEDQSIYYFDFFINTM